LFWQKIEKSSELSKMPDSRAEPLKLNGIAPFVDDFLVKVGVIVANSARASESK
jgi:hypothetical protein